MGHGLPIQEMMSDNITSVLYMRWYEDKDGRRTDAGCSIHSSEEQFQSFMDTYKVDLCYRPDSYPEEQVPRTVFVSDDLFELVKDSEKGIRVSEIKEKELRAKNCINYYVAGISGKNPQS